MNQHDLEYLLIEMDPEWERRFIDCWQAADFYEINVENSLKSEAKRLQIHGVLIDFDLEEKQ